MAATPSDVFKYLRADGFLRAKTSLGIVCIAAGTISAAGVSTVNITVTGAALGDFVFASLDIAGLPSQINPVGVVTAANTVTLHMYNLGAAGVSFGGVSIFSRVVVVPKAVFGVV